MKSPPSPVLPLCTAQVIAAVAGTWLSLGEIATRGFDYLTVWVEFTQGTSTANQIQILSLRESGGTGFVMETSGSYQKTLGNADIDIVYTFELDDSFPFVDFQSVAAALGVTVGLLTIHYSLGNRS